MLFLCRSTRWWALGLTSWRSKVTSMNLWFSPTRRGCASVPKASPPSFRQTNWTICPGRRWRSEWCPFSQTGNPYRAGWTSPSKWVWNYPNTHLYTAPSKCIQKNPQSDCIKYRFKQRPTKNYHKGVINVHRRVILLNLGIDLEVSSILWTQLLIKPRIFSGLHTSFHRFLISKQNEQKLKKKYLESNKSSRAAINFIYNSVTVRQCRSSRPAVVEKVFTSLRESTLLLQWLFCDCSDFIRCPSRILLLELELISNCFILYKIIISSMNPMILLVKYRHY